MATATKSRVQRVKAIVTPDDLRRIMGDVTTNVVVGRKRHGHTLLLGMLAGVNVHQLGPPGTGKSLMLRETCKRIVGATIDEKNAAKMAAEDQEAARYFEKVVHAQMPADAIIGGYDMPRFAKTGEFARNVEHYLPNAHFGFVDEATRANGPTLDALLPMLNSEERAAEMNGGMFRTPLLFIVTASNYMPDPDDPHLGAFVDRLSLMQYIDYVQTDADFIEMFDRHHARRIGERDDTIKRETITLQQFKAAQDMVDRVGATHEFKAAFAQLRRDAKGEGLRISDRAWLELGRVGRASAFLAGRDEMIPEDLSALQDGLWRDRKDEPTAIKLVLEHKSRFEQVATERREEAHDHLEELEGLRPQVEGVPPGDKLPDDLMSKCSNLRRPLKDIASRIDADLTQAKKEKKDVPELRDVADDVQRAREWMRDVVGIPMN